MSQIRSKTQGALVISLDFEILWGVFDMPQIKSYYLNNLLGVRNVIPALLDLFTEYQIHGTFATVGMLFAGTKAELLAAVPASKPAYKNGNRSPYTTEITLLGENETQDPLHYAANLIQLIQDTPDQEIGSHTFCHYYCLEAGQTLMDFRADMEAAVAIAAKKNIALKSLVFPRNQFNEAYLGVLQKLGFTSYRGNEAAWMYAAKNWESQSIWKRVGRLVDSYINLSGHNTYSWETIQQTGPLYNIPSSRFLRPYNPKLRSLEKLRCTRILNDMTEAAKVGHLYHLWWHPHNFGVNLEENLSFLRIILRHYQHLQNQYGFKSLTMSEVADILNLSSYG